MTDRLARTAAQGQAAIWGPVLMCAGGVALFSIMDGLMKHASLAVGVYSAIFWRSILASLLSGAAMGVTRNRWPPAGVMRLHVLRGVIIAVMVWLFFWSLTRLPLAEAIALSFIAPIIALALSVLMLGERVSKYSMAAGVLGLVGVGVILSGRLTGDYDGRALAGALGVLVSAVLFAINLILQSRQARVASAVEVTFFQNIVVLAVFTPLAPWLLTASSIPDSFWWAVAGSALLTCGSQFLLAAAYARAPASRLIPIEYSAFIWATLVGWLMFSEALTLEVLAGVALIVAACLIAAKADPDIAGHIETEVV